MFEKLKSMIGAQTVPVVRIGQNGREINLISKAVIDGGIIRDEWNGAGWEVDKDVRPVKITLDNKPVGIGYVVSSYGKAVNIEENESLMKLGIVWEGVIAKLTMANIMEKAIDLEPSMKSKMIYLLGGVVLGLLIGLVM